MYRLEIPRLHRGFSNTSLMNSLSCISYNAAAPAELETKDVAMDGNIESVDQLDCYCMPLHRSAGS